MTVMEAIVQEIEAEKQTWSNETGRKV